MNARSDGILSCVNPACSVVASSVMLMVEVALGGSMTASGGEAIASNLTCDRRMGATVTS
jgi:hypothetical protein